ncbi:MAG: ral nucleoside transport system permease protein [Oceanotoga sp.]|uniref:ABC transporter permease n=1 Tax=Oceanotoga sp. TaxID=2108366 RepID=UPI00265315E3|nr:ABC transporter permease [Oceanotoga sp.]MDN5342233.1 ral nucleoside transport system permease protein [Oceanotoga sp.]
MMEILHTAIRVTTPIALAALGGLFTHKTGVLNIALEGMMLMAAFMGVVTSYFTGSPLLAIMAAFGVSLIIGLIFSFFGITLKGNFIIVGLAVNMTAYGITAFWLQQWFGIRGILSSDKIIGLDPIDVPILNKIPIISDIFNNHTPIVYVSFLLLLITYITLKHTKIGLHIRVVGENENAAKAVGIKVNKIRYISVLLSSLYCALAGVNLSLESLNLFVEKMTAERGFIALAAIFSGKGTALGTYLFSFIFGLGETFQISLQIFDVPGSLIQTIPFIFVIIILTFIGIKNKKNKIKRGITND